MLVVSYGAIKCIETICRTSQLLFILNLVLFTISVGCLIYYIDTHYKDAPKKERHLYISNIVLK